MREIDVSVVIVSHNTRDLLGNCIRSVQDKTFDISYEIIVVDNASGDGSPELVKRDFPGVKLIANVGNLGFGKGNNLGMKEVSGKYYLLLNPDTVLMNNAIKIMYDFMEKEGVEKRIAVCGASLFDEQDRPAVSFGRFPKPWSMIFYSLPFAVCFRRNGGIVPDFRRDYLFADYVIGAAFFCRKDIVDELGMFDERYFAYYEETDLSKRISLKGFRSAVLPSARIYHVGGQSSQSSLFRKKVMYESSLYYLQKFHQNSVWFKSYCLVNELKYTVYRLFRPSIHKPFYDEMIAKTRLFRYQKRPPGNTSS